MAEAGQTLCDTQNSTMSQSAFAPALTKAVTQRETEQTRAHMIRTACKRRDVPVPAQTQADTRGSSGREHAGRARERGGIMAVRLGGREVTAEGGTRG